GTSGRQRHQGEVTGWIELARGVPPSLVEDEQRMGPRRDGAAGFGIVSLMVLFKVTVGRADDLQKMKDVANNFSHENLTCSLLHVCS
ncbi:MAG: hypothetical protein H0V72_19105, partial [Bradyrhizobium sp.]|nr:hypothetical protein [Bradyrhizobium sp.]